MEPAEIYDQVVDNYIKTFFNDFSDQDELDRFLSLLPKGSKILDIGCGPGQFTKYIIEKGYLGEGIDLSPEMIKAAANLIPDGKFQVMDMRRLSFPPSHFDGLLVAYSFLHISEKDALSTLIGMYKILKPKGILSLLLKEGDGEISLPSTLLPGTTLFVKLWRIESILDFLQKSGFSLINFHRDQPKNPKEFQYTKLLILATKT
jgi:SAM-dependent methyltransferase